MGICPNSKQIATFHVQHSIFTHSSFPSRSSTPSIIFQQVPYRRVKKVQIYNISSKGSDPSVYVLLYMFASYHLPPQQFHRAHASSYQRTTQSPSFHQPRHTLHFSILSILLILSKTSTHSTQSTRLSSSLSVYSVYFVVQISASFAFFAATAQSGIAVRRATSEVFALSYDPPRM